MQAGTAGEKINWKPTKKIQTSTSCPGVGLVGLFLCFSKAAATAAVARLKIKKIEESYPDEVGGAGPAGLVGCNFGR